MAAFVMGIGDALLGQFTDNLFNHTAPLMFLLSKSKVEEARQKEKTKYAHLMPGGPGGPATALVLE